MTATSTMYTCLACGQHSTSTNLSVGLRSVFYAGEEYPTTKATADIVRKLLQFDGKLLPYEFFNMNRGLLSVHVRTIREIFRVNKIPLDIETRYGEGLRIIRRLC